MDSDARSSREIRRCTRASEANGAANTLDPKNSTASGRPPRRHTDSPNLHIHKLDTFLLDPRVAQRSKSTSAGAQRLSAHYRMCCSGCMSELPQQHALQLPSLIQRMLFVSPLPEIQPHTLAKHQILRYYLNEWFPILGSAYGSLRYVDGFAGPGEYVGGQIGSPIIALQTIEQHRYFKTFSTSGKFVEFIFVEKDSNHYKNLQSQISASVWPGSFKIASRQGLFEEAVKQLLLDSRRVDSPPTLVFIDPFGSAGFPMALLERLASFDRMEVLINLNYNEFVQWILQDSSKHVTADRLYGGPRWRPAIELAGSQRAIFLVDEYKRALQEIGWRGTSFEMVNFQNQKAYHLVFGTHSAKGMEAMKRAMRAASPTGEFRYMDRIGTDQNVIPGLEIANEYAQEIATLLCEKYACGEDTGREVAFDCLIKENIDWHPRWLSSDLHKALKQLEYGDHRRIISVRKLDGEPRRPGTYPKGCVIKFGKPLQPRLL